MAASDLYRVLFEQSPDAILVIDPETTCAVDFNDRAPELLGYSREEFGSVRVADYEAVETPEQIRQRMDGLSAREVEEFQTRWRTKSGILREVLLRVRAVSLEGRPLFQVVARDITSRKEVAAALRASEQRYRTIVESQLEFVDRYLPGGILTYVNPSLCRHVGLPAEELLGRSFFRFLHPDDRDRIVAAIENLCPEQPTTVEESRTCLPDGRLRWHRWSHCAMFDEAGKIIEYQSVGRDITAQKEADQRLALLYFALDHAREEVVLADAEARVLYANKQACRALGYSREEFLTKTVADFDPNFSTKAWPAALANLQREGSGTFESEHLTGEGERYPVELSVNCFDFDGKAYVAGFARDISRRHREEERLRLFNDCFIGFSPDAESNINRLTAAVGKMMQADSALYKRLEGNLLCSVGQWQTPPDFPPSDRARGHLCHDIIGNPREGLRVVRDLDRSPFAACDPNVSRYGLKTYVGLPVFWGEEAVGSLCVVYTRDVQPDEADLAFMKLAAAAVAVEEARWRSEQALKEREKFIRAILDSIAERVVVIDRDFRIATANRTFETAMGLDLAEVVGQPCHAIIHHHARPCFEEGEECAVRQVFDTGRPATVTLRRREEEGKEFFLEIKAYPLRDESGALYSAIEIVNDVTVQKQLLAEQLKSQKLEAIGTLAGGIAHDFNNLLQGVFGYLSMARFNLDRKETAAAQLEQAERALNQSINLTGQLLTFAKGGQPVFKRLEVLPVIENAARFALSGTRSELRLCPSQSPWAVEGDAGQLGQIIQNIVINANEAMPDGGLVEVEVENLQLAAGVHAALPDGGQFVRIGISDHGVGIPPGQLGRIFDPYFTTKRQGSGLGLATCYSIVKNHHGHIEVVSTPGAGSRFSVYLPAAAVATGAPDGATAGAAAAVSRVLVMDDEPIVRQVAAEMLDSLGHQVEVTATGEEALERYGAARAAGTPFDVVILDLTVKGGMGGEQAIAELLRIDPQVRAIVSSGYSDNSAVADFRAHGFLAALGKPYRVHQLAQVLGEVLGRPGDG